MFILARALQGMGAAATVPTAMALIATTYPAGPERTRAFSIFGAFGGLGAVCGILLAGGFIASIGWQWIFRVSAIAAFILLAISYIVIPISAPKAEKPKIDYLGAITATLGVTGIVYYISTGVEYGWADPKTIPIFVVALGLIALFIFIESRVHSPLMPLRIWKLKSFTTSVVLAFVSMAKFQGIIYYANMTFQEVYQWTPIQTALGFLVHSLLAMVVFTVLGRMLPRLPLKPLILIGFLLRSGTALMFSFVNEHTSYWALPFPAFIMHIFGVGLSLLPIQITAGFHNAFYAMIAMGLFGFLLAFVILPWDKPVRPTAPTAHKNDSSPSLASTAVPANSASTIEPKDLEEVISFSEVAGHASERHDSDASTIASQPDDIEKGHLQV
ncbi:hypothetical protein BGZ88_006066 [Linnemannia elongata]|nr:hypothetical protein BGZ88_006066 [Linnemannia elongata]